MSKGYKITYKVSFFEKLKEVPFHGLMTKPIYIKIIYKRGSKDFKSTLFDIVTKSKFDIKEARSSEILKGIIREETALMEYILKIAPKDIDLEMLFRLYKFYSLDLCSQLEEAYNAYLLLFLIDQDIMALHKAIYENSSIVLYDVLKDFEKLFKPEIYTKLLVESLKQRQVYTAVFEFSRQFKGARARYFSVFRWQEKSTQDEFRKFLAISYPGQVDEICNAVVWWVREIKLKIGV